MSLTDVECFSSKYNGYDYVDLGLSVKWAAQNIGAVSFGDFGDVYMWGELHPKDDEKSKKCLESQEYWDLLTYMVGNDFRNMLPSELKRIQELTGCRTYGVHIENISANHTYDVARANYGGEWRIPTNREWQELIEMCSWIECIQEHISKGQKLQVKSMETLFCYRIVMMVWDLVRLIGQQTPYGRKVHGDTMYGDST